MTHICISKLTIIGSDNGLSPARRQAIIWTNAGILLIRPLGTNFSEILIEIQSFSFWKSRLKVSSGKWRPFCLCLNVLNCHEGVITSHRNPLIWLLIHAWCQLILVVYCPAWLWCDYCNHGLVALLCIQGLCSLNGRTSYNKISLSLEAVRFGFRLSLLYWNLTATSAAALPRCLSNFRATWSL